MYTNLNILFCEPLANYIYIYIYICFSIHTYMFCNPIYTTAHCTKCKLSSYYDVTAMTQRAPNSLLRNR